MPCGHPLERVLHSGEREGVREGWEHFFNHNATARDGKGNDKRDREQE